jgi:hypothetical protein
MLAAGIVVPLMGAFAAAPATLVPIDPWHVEYNASSCVLRRTFGTATDPVIFAVEPSPYDEVVSLMLLKRSVTTSPSKMGPAAVVLSGGLAPPDLSYSSASAGGFRVTTIVVRREVLAGLKGGQSIAIRAGGEADVVLQPTGLDKAMIALDSCESDLLVAWGFDKDAQAAVAVPPKSTLTGVVRADDYPIDALKKGYGGTVGYRL